MIRLETKYFVITRLHEVVSLRTLRYAEPYATSSHTRTQFI